MRRGSGGSFPADGIRVSQRRQTELQQTGASFVQPPADSPHVGPAILVSFLHNLSMGAAMIVWVKVTAMAFPPEETIAMYNATMNSTTTTTTLAMTISDKIGAGEQGAIEAGSADTKALTLHAWLLAVNAVFELVTSQFVGVASDRFGRRPAHIAAQAGQLVDYGAAAICLPPVFGFMPQVSAGAVAPLLVVTRGIAGLCGNYRVSLNAYTADISTAAECPNRLGLLSALMVVGMCCGSAMLILVDTDGSVATTQSVYLTSLMSNAAIILIVYFTWRDIAPKKNFVCKEANPIGGVLLFGVSSTMMVYAALILMAAFSLNIYTSTFPMYAIDILKMSQTQFVGLGVEWASLAAFSMIVVQPFLLNTVGEIRTLQLTFVSMALFYVLFSALGPKTYGLAYVIIPLLSFGGVSYPLAVGLATREVNPDEQGGLQGGCSVVETVAKIAAPLLGAKLIDLFKGPGQYQGMVYVIAAVVVAPGIFLAGWLISITTTVDADPNRRSVELAALQANEEIADIAGVSGAL